MKALIVAAIVLASCAPAASAPSATPAAAASPSNSPVPTATPSTTPAPTATPSAAPTAPVAAGLTRYVNAELGYSVDLPAGWRRATCSLGVATTSPLLASEFLIGVPETEEVISGGARMLQVRVVDAAGLTPATWLEKNASQPDVHVEPVTLGDKPGARGFIGATGATYGVAVAARGWIYAIEMPYFGMRDPELEPLLVTLRTLSDATVGRAPTATPTARTIESVADAIADGFTRKDPNAITGTMNPCITVGGIPGDAVMRSRTGYVSFVAHEFAAGTSVQVQSRPIESDANGRFVRSTWSKAGEMDQRVDLYFRAEGDRWSLAAIFTRAPGY